MVETLEAGGFTGQQSRVLATSFAEALAGAGVATQNDVLALAAAMELQRTELKHDIASLEQRMTIKFGAMMFALAGFMVAAIRYLPHG